MRARSFVSLYTAILLMPGVGSAAAAGTAAERVGVYDSRVVAFAHFWSEQGRKEREASVAAAKAAKASGDTKLIAEHSRNLKGQQERTHLQVFSTAPADEAMAALKDKLSAIQKEIGVGRFVSKWDEAALKEIPEANRVDVTDRLAREFNPDERRRKTIEQLKKSKPLPLDQAKRAAAEGKM